MSEQKEPLVQDEDRSTEGGPQKGLGFLVIVGAAILIAIIAAVYLVIF